MNKLATFVHGRGDPCGRPTPLDVCGHPGCLWSPGHTWSLAPLAHTLSPRMLVVALTTSSHPK